MIRTKFLTVLAVAAVSFLPHIAKAERLVFGRDFSPAEGLVMPQDKPCRNELCLNGYWELQRVEVPKSWKAGTGIPPELPLPTADNWETVKIKIPSPINVNSWGDGWRVGEGTDRPYAPSTVYFPSYPESWVHTRMAWMRRNFTVPETWTNQRLKLHFEAIGGECVIMVNGQEVCRDFEQHLPIEVDVTDYVNRNGSNEILVGVRHCRLFDKFHPEYKKMNATYPCGSNTDGLLGMWQDVYLLGESDVRITDVFVQPLLDKDELRVEVELENTTAKDIKTSIAADVYEWINGVDRENDNVVDAAEIKWSLGDNVKLKFKSPNIKIPAHSTTKVVMTCTPSGKLKTWTPKSPNLYVLSLSLNGKKKTALDKKSTRFGWRQLKIVGDEFRLNGEKIQCFGDIQHPFSAYVCSRRFAYAWYKMIKDFGGNAVRPAYTAVARVYYDLADEMGLMVLDETALFGSSIRLNLEEEDTWHRSESHLERLIRRDRNHPSVIGWSAGNEMFAIALLNKPADSVAARWNDRLVELTLGIKKLDPTRDFITLDGDRDMDGRLPVWSKHFGHGLKLADLPKDTGKPLIIGENGATYYGRPSQLYPFVGEKAFRDYKGRSEALAIDVYQNVKYMAKPYLAYFSPSEVSWFGVEHMNIGYHDRSRLPNSEDGVFAGKEYEEGRPGYQYERIPPYVCTFNPGLDPWLPLYKPLPMFKALKAALAGEDWVPYEEVKHPVKPEYPEAAYSKVFVAGKAGDELKSFLDRTGMSAVKQSKDADIIVLDASKVDATTLDDIKKQITKGWNGRMLAFSAAGEMSDAFKAVLPKGTKIIERQATALEAIEGTPFAAYFELPDLYFSEMDSKDKHIVKAAMTGYTGKDFMINLVAARTDWSLFNNTAENRKCAQVVLYESLNEIPTATMLTCPFAEGVNMSVFTLDYRIDTKETATFWNSLFKVMQIGLNGEASATKTSTAGKKAHDLLLDGPVD